MKRKSLIGKLIVLLLVLCFLAGIWPVGAAGAGELRISAAASMGDAVKALAADYAKTATGLRVFTNLGSSGALAKQIVQGAPADIFISANTGWMDYLLKVGKIESATVRVLAGNSLVFVGSPETLASSLADLLHLQRIAIGSPRSVPAGQYAEEALRGAGIYDKLLQADKLVIAKDVRQALLYADRGEVDGAFVYKTDGLLVRRAVILFAVPGNLHTPITYPLGLTKVRAENPAARGFYDYLAGAAARATLEKLGFTVPAEPAPESN